ncbi:hypothetical protein J5069_19270 [Candidatus Symbiopectobacterium sp. NZEC127]|uniref:hypothetical protein n=1 Tax=Candidatus Symbiopectobacterium sp. NZEC127 TaxID=2820472 RepID=UPI0022277785|nr:hypothetical protein [Candidatus Symbiopectobacterium sp. NZEC127]MCW2488046.1 hypothetical protein [Candidatus Symbiopectobacterium sp. NZEC127]
MKCQNSTPKIYQPVFTDETPLTDRLGDDTFPRRIKVISCTQEITPDGVVNNREIQRESGMLAYIKQVFFARLVEPKESHPRMLRQLEKGRMLNEKSQCLQQVQPGKGKRAIPLTPKQAAWLGGVILAGAAGGAFYRLWAAEKFNASENVGMQQSEARIIANESDISLDEYNHERDIINQLVVPDIEGYYFSNKNTRSLSYRAVTIKNRQIPNEILRILQDRSINWRVRNEFDLIFRRAENSPDVKNTPKKRERNVKLLIKCLQLTAAFVKENERQAIDNKSYHFGKIYLENLFKIVNRLSRNDKRTVNLFYHQRNDLAEQNDTFQIPTLLNVRKRVFLPKRNDTEPSNIEDVKVTSLVDCRDERDVLTPAKIMRVISRTLRSPVSTLIDEGKIVLDYNVYGIGCVGNHQFDDLAKKIESVIDSILSWIPQYGRGRLVSLILSSFLDMISDAMEKKDLSLDNAGELESYIRNLAKDLISSVLTRQLADNTSNGAISTMMNDIEIKKNKLYINIKDQDKKVEVIESFNHFSDVETKGYIFYNAKKQWVLKGDINLNHVIKSTMKKSTKILNDKENTYFLQNNSPEIYGDSVFIKNKSDIYAMIGNEIFPVLESEVTKKVYRYVVQHDNHLTPIVTRGGEWVFENENSPGISKNILTLLTGRPFLTEKLVSDDINHQDVGPMTLSRGTQYDKHLNQYIKINNKYYLLKSDLSNYQYLSGEYDVLPVKQSGDEYDLQSQYADGIYTNYKEQLDELPTRETEPAYYLDKTIVDVIKNNPQWYKNSISLSDADFLYEHLGVRDIDGALNINNENFLPYKNRLLKITSRGDDTYILGETNSNAGNVIIYKNEKSNTYFLFPERRGNSGNNKNYRLRAYHCIAKRQILSLCNMDFYETKDISTLLRRNQDHGIIIDHPDKSMTPYVGVNGFYKNSGGEIFYRSKEGLFFHAKEKKNNNRAIVPEYFTLHGKNMDGSIDDKMKITAVSIIKDFDTKKIIVSTPVEAQETILGIDKKSSIKLLEWLEIGGEKYDVDVDKLAEIPKRLSQDNNMDDVYEIFARSSKKILTSIKEMDAVLPKMKDRYFGEEGEFDFKSLPQLAAERSSSIIYDIYSESFNNAVKHLNDAVSVIKNERHFFESYVSDRIQIKDKKASKFFIDSLLKKLKRMTFILDEKNNENIILLIKNKSKEASVIQPETIKKGTVLGLSDTGDPLDRIFINTAILPEGFNPSVNEFQGFQEKEKYINLATSTMLHEAVHAIGLPEDYIYLSVKETGEFVSIERSLAQIKYAIANDIMDNEKFSYLCNLYFMSNPVYKDFSLESLMKPGNLQRLFQIDDYFKGILLINNPDTVSQIISDVAKKNNVLLRRVSAP